MRTRLRLTPRTRSRTRHELVMLWAKSLSWRAVSTGVLLIVGALVTGEWSTGGIIAFIHMVITIVLYVPHDLLWDRLELVPKNAVEPIADRSRSYRAVPPPS